jgi:hypothetical protein
VAEGEDLGSNLLREKSVLGSNLACTEDPRFPARRAVPNSAAFFEVRVSSTAKVDT